MRFHARTASTSWALQSDPAEDWRARAACRDHDPETWFPLGTGDAAEALSICRQDCPVRVECSRWAVDHGITDGIWGMPEQQLRRLVAASGTSTPRAPHRLGECAKGHARTPRNTHIDKDGHRSCKVCARERKAATPC